MHESFLRFLRVGFHSRLLWPEMRSVSTCCHFTDRNGFDILQKNTVTVCCCFLSKCVDTVFTFASQNTGYQPTYFVTYHLWLVSCIVFLSRKLIRTIFCLGRNEAISANEVFFHFNCVCNQLKTISFLSKLHLSWRHVKCQMNNLAALCTNQSCNDCLLFSCETHDSDVSNYP